ncbi:copper homeostasis protein CutC [Octadecabacter sp. R77987]|uniref:copper homeostasis protein CutC n=1 Tax=Octadecabacter sp. R77987 TaxID=3093874 RepID=UPI00366CE707
MPPNSAALEVCVDTAEGLSACQIHADRIELCSALELGGLTPSPGLLAIARDSKVPVHAMIRPRAGDFSYDDHDLEACLQDIAAVHAAGLAGVVLGAFKDRELDLVALAKMRAAAGDMACTLHRVIDLVDHPLRALEDAIALGFDRILTSGGAVRAPDGIDGLAALQGAAAGRITVMAGSGVTAQNLGDIAAKTGIYAFHASCSLPVAQGHEEQAFGFATASRNRTDPARIAQMRAAIDALPGVTSP